MDINTDCGSSLSVVSDDISIGGTNITASIREYTFSWGNVNDNDEYISNCHKETIDDVDSTNVIYNKDYDSTIKTETSQGQILSVDDDYGALETVHDSNLFKNTCLRQHDQRKRVFNLILYLILKIDATLKWNNETNI